MSRLLDGAATTWKGVTPETVNSIDEPDLSGFEMLQDMRILDLRNWDPSLQRSGDSSSQIYGYRRIKVFKKTGHSASDEFRIFLLPSTPEAQVRFPPQVAPGRARIAKLADSQAGQEEYRWEAVFDLKNVPAGEYVDLIVEHRSLGEFLHGDKDSTTLSFEIQGDTAEVTRWLLLPEGHEYRDFRVVRHKSGQPESAEKVNLVTEYLADDYTILAYKLLSVPAGYTYEVTWFYK